MHTIVTLTMNPAIDTSTTVDRVVPEHKLRCAAPRHEPGGGGINVSCAIRKLGDTSLALYLAGGPTGAILQEQLLQDGVAHQPMPIAGWTRESFTVLDEATQLQYRFSMPGPTLRKAEWQRCLDTLAALDPSPDYLVASGRLPPGVPSDFYARVARIGRALGARVIVDKSGKSLHETLREPVFLMKPGTELCRRTDTERLYERIAAAPTPLERITRYICEAALAPTIEAALAANGFTVAMPLQQQLGGPTSVLLTHGATSVLLSQLPNSNTATIEVWGDNHRTEQLLESVPIKLLKQP